MGKKDPQQKTYEGSGVLIPILVAAMVCVVLTTTFIVGYGLQYTAEQRAIEAQQSESAVPARSMPSSSESPVQIVPSPPEQTESEPQQPEESEPEEESQTITPPPSASPSASAAQLVSPSPSSAPPESLSPAPSLKPSESQALASQPVQSNTPKTLTGNDRDSKFANGMVLATTKSNNGGKPVYHTWDCRAAQKVASESELWYESEQAAIADGRDWCGICSKR